MCGRCVELTQKLLPEGFRIQEYEVSRDWDGAGYYAQRLEQWKTWTARFWWFKRKVSGWCIIERNNHREPLIETAWMLAGGRP